MTTTPDPVAPENAEPTTDAPAAEVEPQPDGADALGDAGKQALDRMKADKKAAEARARTAEQEIERLKAAAEGREAEWQSKQDAQAEADARFRARVLNAEIRAAAKGVLADPADALRYLDTKDFDVADDGTVDAAGVAAAIQALVTEKPYLAAQGGPRFTGTPDANPRNAGQEGPVQLTREQLAALTPEQRVAAHEAGQLNDLLGVRS